MRRQWLVGVYVTFVLAFVGLVVLLAGCELFIRAPQDALNLSPYVVLALGGLCLAALMFVFWFGLVGVLLARQTRARRIPVTAKPTA